MSSPFTLFEVSWEVANKVGGIHTVLSTKAQTMVDLLGDQYITVGPWLLGGADHNVPFDADPEFDDFAESCRDMGIPVRVGRWRVPGRPRAILVEFSRLLQDKDAVLARLWEDYEVDSISGGWDYSEPVLFGWAVGKVIEQWWEEFLAPERRRAIVHTHEWMTGSAMLYLRQHVPAIGSVFTTHATMLGRALSSTGHSPEDGLGGKTAAELAADHGVVAKHSIEGTCAHQADVFTTVSEVTAAEATLLHDRRPDPILTNGIDLAVVDEMAGPVDRVEARQQLADITSRFLGEKVDDALFLGTSGRYEFRNKGIDLLLDAAAELNEEKGRQIVVFVLVPGGNSGIRSELRERLDVDFDSIDGPLGLSTHNLFDEEHDPVHEHCARVGLDNAPNSRVKVVQIPIYLDDGDDFLGLPYLAILRALDLTCFPSYYEPWGYTPQESVAVGVPTITSDYAGFGRWARSLGPKGAPGVTVLDRVHVQYGTVVKNLAASITEFLREAPDVEDLEEQCRRTAAMTEWSDVVEHYQTAYDNALGAVQGRLEGGVVQRIRPKKPLAVLPQREGERPRLFRFDVSATLPPELAGLRRLAENYWWSWDPEGCELFRDLSPRSWERTGHNPLLLLQNAYPQDLADRAADPEYLAKLERVVARFEAYMVEESIAGRWSALIPDGEKAGVSAEHPVAYFCAEYGIHESLRIYSGGLGILAGDHLKSASDLNLPLLGIGLFYRNGYLSQRVTSDGEQIAGNVDNDPRALPFTRVVGKDGEPVDIVIELPGRDLHVAAWRLEVGRVSLYLLDTDLPTNREEDREITRHLYGGDQETRIRQEIVLGRGGVRLLRALEILPAVWHMNEGHSAFLTLERVGQLARREGLTFEEARELVRATTMFTTHTPVPAGHDRFGEDLMRRYFSDVHGSVGIPWERFYELGLSQESRGEFNMTYLALGFSSFCNGVSKLHGIASRNLLHQYWPRLIEAEVPVDSVTNGIHLATWTHPDIARALGVHDRGIRGEDFAPGATPEAMDNVWHAKQRLKLELLERVRNSLEEGFVARGDSPVLLTRILDNLDEHALVIGFARRFAPYKRAHLLFQDRERLIELLSNDERPVRILIAGKAHPADGTGKGILRHIYALSRSHEFAGKIIFVEDYDIALARSLVAGVDVWLNNPTRMLEASGTSGMKASANGVLNLSIGDGWWPEGFNGENGWMIGGDRSYHSQEQQDQLDATTLYRLLEEEIVPTFHERDPDGVPRRWVDMMAANLRTIPPVFDTDRMVSEYFQKAYRPLGCTFASFGEDRNEKLRGIAREVKRLRKGFEELRIVSAEVADLSGLKVGESVSARVEVDLGALEPADVAVELVLGHARGENDLYHETTVALASVGEPDGTVHVFDGFQTVDRSGNFAYGLRVRAKGGSDSSDILRDLVLWA